MDPHSEEMNGLHSGWYQRLVTMATFPDMQRSLWILDDLPDEVREQRRSHSSQVEEVRTDASSSGKKGGKLREVMQR